MKRKVVISLMALSLSMFIFGQDAGYLTKENIPYCDEVVRQQDRYIAERCVLDIYYPEDTKNFATIVWFHGGGLTGGNKSVPQELKGKGFCVVAVNYRLHPEVTCPKYIEDAAAAVSWVFANIEKYGGDPRLIFVSGHSAGAYLTFMVGLDKRWLKPYNIDPDRIAALLPLSGNTITHLTIRKERSIPDTQPYVDEYAPLYHVRADAPPLIMMTGDREQEMLGRYEENAYMLRMMKIAGHPHAVLHEFDGYGHGMLEPAFPLVVKYVNERIREIRNIDAGNPPMERFNNVTFELSLKPFKKNEPTYIESVCRTIYAQWAPLIKYADTVSFMFWTADGSEILDYRGNPEQPLEWGKYIGNPNTEHAVNSGPETLSLHERAYTYMDNPPVFTYGDLKNIVATLKRVGKEMTGKPVRVGDTFDPGPEFAISKFKYELHPEICMANTMGSKSFVCCYATLNGDREKYAGFPDGIPQGTPLGTFLGRQSQVFLTDMGFDYLWLSNGFGFGMETWNATGAIFDGKEFHPEKLADIQQKILNFWTLFRKECPELRIETRGTNLSTGIDLASDGVDLRSIYQGGFNLLPPPNSPWAALNGDYGLELVGYMSRMAELPDERYLFRFYTHDPWWANSPWLDRYGREPHDIYLPMAVSRINSKGEVRQPTHLNFLSIDDSYGNMPDQVPNEVIPHILQGRRIAPDQPGQVVWVYPFEEYHNWAFNRPGRIGETFYGDWFIRQALNDGFPLNTVVSTTNFASLMQQGNRLFDGSVLVTIVPEAGSEVEKQLMAFVRKGGNVIIYGPATHGSKEFLDFMNVRTDEALSGEFELTMTESFDRTGVSGIQKLRHDGKWSGGGIETVIANANDPSTKVLVKAHLGNAVRDIVVMRGFATDFSKSKIIYVRGTNSASYRGGQLLTPDDPEKWFTGGSLMRYALSHLGYAFRYNKLSPSAGNPVNVVSRHDNGFYFAGFTPDQSVEQQLRFPQGAPVFTGMETELKDGYALYHLPKAWSKECRLFVEQHEGILSCREVALVEYHIKRKIAISGLKNATVRFYPGTDETYFKAMNGNNHHPAKPDTLISVPGNRFPGIYYEYRDITGQLVFTW